MKVVEMHIQSQNRIKDNFGQIYDCLKIYRSLNCYLAKEGK